MCATPVTQRLVRPLAVVIAVVLGAGAVAAIAWDDGRGAVAEALGRGDDRSTDRSPSPAATPVETDPGDDVDGGSRPGDVDPAEPPGLAVSAVVPAAGEYRYEVRVTRDGSSATVDEVRRIEVLDGDTTAASIRLEVQTGDQRQISVLDWRPGAVAVVSTRVPTPAGGEDCVWDPPFLEFGPLTADSTWAVSSACQAAVGGVPSSFEVNGTATVVGDVQVRVGADLMRVWRIERSRTTIIRASIGGEPVEQRVDERGDLYLDPARGIVVQADVTLTTTGAQSGTTRRQSTLVP